MMKSDNWEIIEQDLLGKFTVKVWLINRSSPTPAVAHIVNGNIELAELKEGSAEIEPTFEINYDAWKALKKSMTEQKTREKNEVEAELGATKYHLEDLRRLLKLETK